MTIEDRKPVFFNFSKNSKNSEQRTPRSPFEVSSWFCRRGVCLCSSSNSELVVSLALSTLAVLTRHSDMQMTLLGMPSYVTSLTSLSTAVLIPIVSHFGGRTEAECRVGAE
jgi:hypothetical protein